MILFLCIPILGLILGAILPPFLFRRRWSVALALNIIGFLLFFLPFALAGAWDFYPELPPEQRTMPEQYWYAMAIITADFFVFEGLIFLLLWLKRCICSRCRA